MYHCRKTSLGSTILGAAWARIDCVTYCFKYLAKFVDQVDLCTGLEVGIPDSNQAGQVLLGVFGRLRYSHQIAPLTSREIIVYCQTVKEAWKKKTLEEGWVTLYWTSFFRGEGSSNILGSFIIQKPVSSYKMSYLIRQLPLPYFTYMF